MNPETAGNSDLPDSCNASRCVMTNVRGRFAPSPTGRMHAGNIFASLMCWLIVKSYNGTMVLRLDDLDIERSRSEYSETLMADLELLGLTWDEGPYRQQGRDEAYAAAFEKLAHDDLLYPCFCTRADLKAASAPHRGEKAVYPGTCAALSDTEVARRSKERKPAWRVRVPDAVYALHDLVQGDFAQRLSSECGDFVVRRSDGLFAYQLATVVDDAEEGINLIVRGMDLLVSTPQQMFLQEALGYSRSSYAHVPLFVSARDRRLSKRDKDAGMDELIARFGSPEAILGHIAFLGGIIDRDCPVSCEELLDVFDVANLENLFDDKVQILWR